MDILTCSSELYVKLSGNFEIIDYETYDKKEELKKVLNLTLVKKNADMSELDIDILNLLNYNYSNIKDRTIQYKLGSLYENGVDGSVGINGRNFLTIDKVEGMRWYRLAAAQGDVDAQYKIGYIYWNGDSVKEDKVEGMCFLKLAADQGSAIALFMISEIFMNENKINDAIHYLHLAAERGQTVAQFLLGNFYKEGFKSVIKKNINEAIRWYRIAAKHEYADAQYELASILYADVDIKKKEEAIMWFTESAKNGNDEAAKMLSSIKP
jgi:TPR repeat protein